MLVNEIGGRAMTDRPIIFSAPMVRALLQGTKTQTRRILNPQPIGTPWFWEGDEVDPAPVWFDGYESGREPCGAATREVNDPLKVRYAVGDRLYVRENFTIVPASAYRCSEGVQFTVNPTDRDEAAIYAAGWDRSIPKWKPSIHQPRWASRITLTVTDVRVQRLQDISAEDARDEGVNARSHKVRQMWLFGANAAERDRIYLQACPWEFEDLWNSIHGADAWEANPWIVALTFTVAKRNIDQE